MISADNSLPHELFMNVNMLVKDELTSSPEPSSNPPLESMGGGGGGGAIWVESGLEPSCKQAYSIGVENHLL